MAVCHFISVLLPYLAMWSRKSKEKLGEEGGKGGRGREEIPVSIPIAVSAQFLSFFLLIGSELSRRP